MFLVAIASIDDQGLAQSALKDPFLHKPFLSHASILFFSTLSSKQARAKANEKANANSGQKSNAEREILFFFFGPSPLPFPC